jgi:peptidylamidoglycolate lyase
MVQDSQGRILLLTNETKNNVLIYNKSGKLLDYLGARVSWRAWLNAV